MQTSDFKDIRYERDEQGIATLILNTPARKNALSMYSFYEIYLAVEAFEKDPAAHVMVITGAIQEGEIDPSKHAYSSGGYFSQDAYDGLDPQVLAQLDFTDIAQKRTTLKLFECDKPIIAAVNGLAIGGAVTMTLAGADQIYMSEHAWLQLPFAKLGISAELASSFLLPRLVGLHKAKEIMFFADRIDAPKAKQLMLANEVVPHSELMTFAREKALQLAPPAGATLAIREMKKLIREPLLDTIADALDRENATLAKLFQSADFAEGVAARVERRAAVFKGE